MTTTAETRTPYTARLPGPGPGGHPVGPVPARLGILATGLAGFGYQNPNTPRTMAGPSITGEANPPQERPAPAPLPAAAPAGRRRQDPRPTSSPPRPATARPRRPVPSGSGVEERRLLGAQRPAPPARRRTRPRRAVGAPMLPVMLTGGNGAQSNSRQRLSARAAFAYGLTTYERCQNSISGGQPAPSSWAAHKRGRRRADDTSGPTPRGPGRQCPPRPRCLVPRHPGSPVSPPGRTEHCPCNTFYYSTRNTKDPLLLGKGPDLRKLVAGAGFEPATSGL